MRKKRFGRRLSAMLLSLLLITGNFAGTTTSSFVYADEDGGSEVGGGSGDSGKDTSGSSDTGSHDSKENSSDQSSDDGSGDSRNGGSQDSDGGSGSQDSGSQDSDGGSSDAGKEDGSAGDTSDGNTSDSGDAAGDNSGSDASDTGSADNTDKADTGSESGSGSETGNTGTDAGSSEDKTGDATDDTNKGDSGSGTEGTGDASANTGSGDSASAETSAEAKTDESKSEESKADESKYDDGAAETGASDAATDVTEAESKEAESADADGTSGNGGIAGDVENETKESETETAESVAGESLPEETLETEEAKKEIELLFHVVDENGQDVDDKYNDVKVKFDKEGILTLDDSEKAPVKKVRRQTGSHLFGLIKTYSKEYTYKEATLNGDVIKAVKKTKNEDKETVYEYTIDGSTWTELDDGAEIILVYVAPDSDGVGHAEYIEEGRIKVTVDMNKELPEGVELRVSELKSDDDNYNAYMTALDDAAKDSDSEVKEHTEENTMLYDIAFIGTDEEGREYEYQPGDDVSVKVSFLGGQLAGELGATDASSVEVKHLPIKDEVKENAANGGQLVSADITGLNAADISVEEVNKPKVTLDKAAVEAVQTASLGEDSDEVDNNAECSESKDEVTFGVSSFCVFSFTSGEQAEGTYWNGSKDISVSDFKKALGLAGHTAVYADQLIQNYSHLEGTIVVNKYVDYGNNHLNQTYLSNNNVVSITLNKRVYDTSNTERVFKMRFFKSKNPTSATDDLATDNVDTSTVEVKVPADSTSGKAEITTSTNPAIFDALEGDKLYVYEIDDADQIATGAYYDSNQSKKYTVSYSSDDSEDSGEIVDNFSRFGNYIGEIDKYFGDPGFHTYLGSDHVDSIFTGNNGLDLKILHSDGTTNFVLRRYKQDITKDDNTQKYIHNLSQEDFQKETGLNANLGIDRESSKFGNLSVELADAKNGVSNDGTVTFNVINLISNYGDLQKDLEYYAGFDSIVNGGGQGIKELLKDCEKNDEYLLINIDASKFSDKYTLSKLVIDRDDSGTDYPRMASHVVYNIVKRDGNDFVPYGGLVDTGNSCVAGMIFAPNAKVSNGSGIRGSVIANKVYFGNTDGIGGSGEIHQKSFGSSERRYVDITISNDSPEQTPTLESVTATLSATKELTGKNLEENEFSFELKNVNGEVLQTKRNNAEGSITFDPISYTEPGTYNYTITEVAGNDTHYRYDSRPVTATVTISKDEDGKLTSSVAYSEKTTFNNTYIPDPDVISVTLEAKKILQKKKLEENQFSFQLKDNTDELLDTKQNDGSGKITFKPLTYSEQDVGQTYTYKITEVKGTDTEHYTYDEHEITATVRISLGSDNKLKANVTYAGDTTFTNEYHETSTKPVEPSEESSEPTESTESTESSTEATRQTESTKSTESSTEATKSTESSTEATKPTESSTQSTESTTETTGSHGGGGGGGGGNHSSKKETTPGRVEGEHRDRNKAETEAPGEVLGVERDRVISDPSEVIEESEGTVKGVSRGSKTGDNSLMRLFGVGFVGAAVLLLGWLWVRLRRKEH